MRIQQLRSVFFFAVFLVPFFLGAQGKYSLTVHENGNENVLRKIRYGTRFNSVSDRDRELKKILIALYDNARLAAHYDSIRSDSLNTVAWISPGSQHRWAELKPGNIDEGILSDIGYREKLYRNRPLRYRDFARMQEKILNWCDQNGYPFASVQLDSAVITGDYRLRAILHIEKNTLFKIDSIIIKGKARITQTYLCNYLDIHTGQAYNENKLRNATARIRELPFVRESQPFITQFIGKTVRITFFLEKKRASRFDGIIGLLPDAETGKILFTGDVQLRLQNSFGRGELLDLNWRRLQEQTQDLKARVNYPYLFRTPFGIDYQIKLYRRDTSFIDVNQNFGIQYLISGTNSLRAFIATRSSSLLSAKQYSTATTLPPFADISALRYGLALNLEKLDYRFNPRRGYRFAISADIGNRNIRRNSELNPIVYENINLRTVQAGGELLIEKFWPIFKRSTIRTSLSGSTIRNTQLFRNELFRIGGLKSLRGFDEESIFASSFAVTTIEYRFILEENSYLYVFGDGCWYENLAGTFATDTPYGFGAGISFEIKAGIFSINYALGSQQGNPIQLKSGKVHFGLVGLF